MTVINKEKSSFLLFLAWLPPFGLLGGHHFYLQRYSWGFLYFFTIGLFGLGWLTDIFRLPSLICEFRNPPAVELKKKNVAYTLWFGPGGFLGFHHFYLGEVWWGLLYFFTLGLLGCGWIFDMFLIPGAVNDYNRRGPGVKRVGKVWWQAVPIQFSPIGMLGGTHAYLGRPGWALLYFCTIGLFMFGWLYDCFRLPWLLEDAQEAPTRDRYGAPKRKLGDAYVLLLSPVGIFGGHRFYANQPCVGFLYLCTCGVFCIGWLIDICYLPTLIKQANEKLSRRYARRTIEVLPAINAPPPSQLPMAAVNQAPRDGGWQPATYGAPPTYSSVVDMPHNSTIPPPYTASTYGYPAPASTYPAHMAPSAPPAMPSPPQPRASTSGNPFVCGICGQWEVEMVAEPCGHHAVCGQCGGSQMAKFCPVCGSDVIKFTRIRA